MDIILLKDVKKVGKKGDIINVKDGYARHLISSGEATEASAKNQNDLMLQKKRAEKEAAEKLAAAKELAEKLANISIKVGVKTGKDGKLFGSVSSKEIADAFKEQMNVEVDKKKILLESPIKELGITDVDIKLHAEVTGKLHVEVVAL